MRWNDGTALAAGEMPDSILRHYILRSSDFNWGFGIIGTMEKVARELAKITKSSLGNFKNIEQDVGKLVDKLGAAAGGKAGGGAGGAGGGGDMEAKVKKIQDQMKELADLSDEIQKSLADIAKNMDK